LKLEDDITGRADDEPGNTGSSTSSIYPSEKLATPGKSQVPFSPEGGGRMLRTPKFKARGAGSSFVSSSRMGQGQGFRKGKGFGSAPRIDAGSASYGTHRGGGIPKTRQPGPGKKVVSAKMHQGQGFKKGKRPPSLNARIASFGGLARM
jgi:hypothetical protein